MISNSPMHGDRSQELPRLKEIDLFRLFIICLLVVMHSFTTYSGHNVGWPLPDGIHSVKFYMWIQKFSFAFILESFTFISGYLFALQVSRNRFKDLSVLIISKVKRLIVPSVIFSVIYWFLFVFDTKISYLRFAYDLLSGIGHLWYLPMLFLCFIETWVLLRIPGREQIKIVVLAVVSIFSILVPNVLRIGQSLYYLFFFYLGFVFFTNRISIKMSSKQLIIAFVLWVLSFVCLGLISDCLSEFISDRVIVRLVRRVFQFFVAIGGTLLSFAFCTRCSSRFDLTDLLRYSQYSFGVYIFHEFILKLLYYKSPVPQIVGSYYLGWIGLIITIPISFFLSWLFLKTRLGRRLIG